MRDAARRVTVSLMERAFWAELSTADEARWAQRRDDESFDHARVMLWLLVVLNVGHLIAFAFSTPVGAVVVRWHQLMVLTHATSLVGSLLGLGLWYGARRRPWVRQALPTGVMAGTLLVGTALAVFDQLITSAVTPMMAANLGMAVMFRPPPWRAVVLHAASAALFLVLGPRSQAAEALQLTMVVNGVSVVLMAAVLGVLFTGLHRRDFSQRCTIERQNVELERSSALAHAANTAKSQFLASMSHELRTPLNGVIGVTELLGSGPLESGQRRLVETLDEASHALLTIINSVLDFSKIEAGQVTLEQVPVDLKGLLDGVRALFSAQAMQKQLALTVRWPDEAPAWALGDPTRLRQVVSNLVANALKFTERGGVTVEATFDGEKLGVRVRDTGLGISAEQLTRLFAPFVQADTSTTRRFGGTGLGLAISKRLVEQMGGAIGAEGTPGVGSTFWFEVPLPRSAPQALVPELPQGPLPPMRVLLAEDNPINVLVATGMLARLGVEALVAHDGREALALLETVKVDLVFTDLHMPELDGFGLASALRARGFTPPIVALTADALPEDQRRCLELGMNDTLSKPFKQAELERVLRRWGPPGSSSLAG
jgi:signal transduction histidine kinase